MNKHRQMTLFMYIVDCGSISKAAEKLELSKSVLSGALKQLESELDTTLLKRTTRKQSLTVQGEMFYQHCLAMNKIVDQAWDEMRETHQAPSGNLTITAPHALVETVITPALARAFAAYPQVCLNIRADDDQLDLMQNDIDLAIRVGESGDSSYKQRKIGAFRDVLCQQASCKTALKDTNYIANHWQGKQITHTMHSISTGEVIEHRFLAKHRVNTINQVAAMITHGMGIGIVPEFVLPRYPQLSPCLPDYALPSTNVYALHPYSRTPPIAVSMARDAIEEQLISFYSGKSG
jgi:DNA-binding transcriptional LysR family regulator